jgi:hypothetical protein
MGSLSLFVRPLDPQACAKGLNAPKLLTRIAPRVLVGGSARVIGRASATLRRVSLERMPAFDERVNALWSAASRQHEVLVKRDFEYLKWRYDDGPHQPLYQRYYLRRGPSVVGYAVVRLEPWHDHVVGRVIDYMTERTWLSPLFALVFEELHVQGAVAVFVEHQHPGCEKLLRKLGCLRVRASQRFMLNVRDRASPLLGALGETNGWFVTPGDGDYDHVLIAPEVVPAY